MLTRRCSAALFAFLSLTFLAGCHLVPFVGNHNPPRLLIVDGERQSCGRRSSGPADTSCRALSAMVSSGIVQVIHLESAAATQYFGPAGRMGATVVETSNFTELSPPTSQDSIGPAIVVDGDVSRCTREEREPETLGSQPPSGAARNIVLNNSRSRPVCSELAALAEAQVKTVQVVRGRLAQLFFGPAARAGAIVVTLADGHR